ncbi:MAG: hypothetical protein WCJ35_20810 [Planctomycetota bacterium]
MPLFTRDNAREMSKRGNLARWSRPLISATIQPPTASPDAIPDDFTAQRLARVRKQLALVDSALEEEAAKGAKADGQRVDRLAAASMRLSDQEFALSNRPKPGNRRPGPERGPKSQGGAFWGSNPAQQTASPPAPAQPETPTPEEPETPTESP